MRGVQRCREFLVSNVLLRVNRILRHLVPNPVHTGCRGTPTGNRDQDLQSIVGAQLDEVEDLLHLTPDKNALDTPRRKRKNFLPILAPGFNHPLDIEYMDEDGDIAHGFFEAHQDGTLRKVWPLDNVIVL